MIANIGKRKRKVDLDKLTNEQCEAVGEALAKKIGKITDECAKQVTEVLNIYGLTAKMAIQLIDKKSGKVI